MKITAKLALSQVRLNRYRTLGAVMAIALSTALLTAVSCFVSSGNAMLVNFMGEDYGEYGNAYSLLLLVPAIIFGLLIFFMSVTVISNVFETSANKQMKQFGIMKCVGTTTKQIKETVIWESLWLSMIGIPIGLILGIGLGFLGILVTGKFVEDINTLGQSIIMRPISLSLSFVITPLTLVCSALFSFMTVLYSGYKPAKKAGKITALSCIRGLGEIKVKETLVRDRKWIKKLFGFEGILADRNLSRNKQSYKATIRSLALGMMLILSTGSLREQMSKMQEYMTPKTQEIMVDYCSSRERRTNETTGKIEEKARKPISSQEAEKVTTKLKAYGEEILGIGCDNATYIALLEGKYLTDDMREKTQCVEGKECELDVEIIVFDEKNYEKLCELAGVPVGGTILLNHYSYNDNGYLKEIIPFSETLSEIKLQKASGESSQLTIDGFLQKESIPLQAFGVNVNPLRIVVPEADVRFYDWYSKPSNEQDYITYARKVTDEFFPTYTDDSYVKEGFTVRISRTDTMVKVLNIAIVIAEVVLYGFVALLLLIGLVSVMSTLSTNILVRAREFAVLKSVGMTTKGIQKMLLSESIICTMKAMVWGIPIGILIPYTINLAIRKLFAVRYEVPWVLILVSVISIFLLILFIAFYTIHKLKKQNIIESIRMEAV